MTHETVVEQQVRHEVLLAQPPPAIVLGQVLSPQIVGGGPRSSVIVASALAAQILVALGGSGSPQMNGYALETTLQALKAVAQDVRDRLPASGAAAEGTLQQIKDLVDGVEGLLASIKDNTDPIATQLVGLLTNTSGLALDLTLQSVRDRLPMGLHFDRLKVSDRMTAPEYLEDQDGTGAAIDFDFSAAPDLTWVTCVGGNARAAFNAVPNATKGVPCDDGIPTPIAISGYAQLKVFAPLGSKVKVYGSRYS